MDIMTLFWILMAGEIGLLAYFLVTSAKEKIQEKCRNGPAQEGDSSRIRKLEAHIKSLQDELEKTKASYAVAQVGLADLQKKKSDVSEELRKQKELYETRNAELEQLKRESSKLKDTLVYKEEELQKIIPQSSALEKELTKKNEEFELLENKNKEMNATLRDLESQLEGLEKEKAIQSSAGLEEHITSLQDELEKARASYAVAQGGLGDLQKKKSELSEELRKQRESYETKNAELEQLKLESSKLKDTLVFKEEEIQKILPQSWALEKELTKKDGIIQLLENQNKEMNAKLRDLESQLEVLANGKEAQEAPRIPEAAVPRGQTGLEPAREQKKKRIGEILLEHNFITSEILDKAIEHQKKFGGNLTQYLLVYGYIDEGKLAQCLCTQFGIPYLPLSSYEVSYEIIKLVPVDIAERYLLVPVDRVGDVLMVVMADPLNDSAIKEVGEITGCKVQVFLGLLSEIVEALRGYYNIVVKAGQINGTRAEPFFIDTKTYKGSERREAIRYSVKIDIALTGRNRYQTKDVSREGLSFICKNPAPVGSFMTFQINLPTEVSPLPIAAVARVMRVVPLKDNSFEIGAKIMKISEEELNCILKYAATHRDE